MSVVAVVRVGGSLSGGEDVGLMMLGHYVTLVT